MNMPPIIGAAIRRITSEPAPWANARDKPVASDLKALIGHTVSFKPDRIDAPAPLACRKPHYEIKPYAPDMLFQGALSGARQSGPRSGPQSRDSRLVILEEVRAVARSCSGPIAIYLCLGLDGKPILVL